MPLSFIIRRRSISTCNSVDALIHFAGDFSESQIRTTITNSPHPLPPEVASIIESTWTDALARLGPRLHDGPMLRLNSWQIAGGNLHLNLGHTSYKPFMGTNLMHAQLADQYGNEILANPLGLSAALESTDGFLLLGRRNNDVAFYPNRIHPFAGTLDQPNVLAGIRKELQEEVNLRAEDIADIRCIGLAEDRTIRQPELVFWVKSNRTRAEIERTLDPHEHNEIVAIRCDETEIQYAMRRADLTPIAVATLRVWSYGATRRA
jgi:hypothetical protein